MYSYISGAKIRVLDKSRLRSRDRVRCIFGDESSRKALLFSKAINVVFGFNKRPREKGDRAKFMDLFVCFSFYISERFFCIFFFSSFLRMLKRYSRWHTLNIRVVPLLSMTAPLLSHRDLISFRLSASNFLYQEGKICIIFSMNKFR